MTKITLPAELFGNDDIIEEIYGDINHTHRFDLLSTRCILTPYNKDTIELCNQQRDRMPGESKSYFSDDHLIQATSRDELTFQPEILNALTPNSLPLHEIKLKINEIIILMRNLDVSKGLCNGTRLQVINLHDHVIQARIICGDPQRIGEIVFIPRITLHSEPEHKLPTQFARHQFPIRSAFALTINKSQGQTFDKVGLYLNNDVFAHGQFYVGTSRVRTMNSLRIKINPEKQEYKVKNIVYKDILD